MEKYPGHRQVFMLIVYLLFLILIAFGFTMIFRSYPPLIHLGNWMGLIFILSLLSFFSWVLIYSLLHDLAYYKVDKEGITLCSLVHKNTLIPYDEISSIKWLSSEEITRFWHEYQKEFLGAEVNYDLSSIFKMRRTTKYLTRYSTINPVYKTTSMGNERNITSLKTFKVKGKFILLTTKDGRNYYMTPKEPGRMIQKINMFYDVSSERSNNNANGSEK